MTIKEIFYNGLIVKDVKALPAGLFSKFLDVHWE